MEQVNYTLNEINTLTGASIDITYIKELSKALFPQYIIHSHNVSQILDQIMAAIKPTYTIDAIITKALYNYYLPFEMLNS